MGCPVAWSKWSASDLSNVYRRGGWVRTSLEFSLSKGPGEGVVKGMGAG